MERVKVRIAVAVDEVGNWYGCGGSALEVADSISLAKSGVPVVGPSLFWLEAELPVPCETVIRTCRLVDLRVSCRR